MDFNDEPIGLFCGEDIEPFDMLGRHPTLIYKLLKVHGAHDGRYIGIAKRRIHPGETVLFHEHKATDRIIPKSHLVISSGDVVVAEAAEDLDAGAAVVFNKEGKIEAMNKDEVIQEARAPERSAVSTDTSSIQKKVIGGMEFLYIGTEVYREYDVLLPGQDKPHTVRINRPEWVFIRPSQSHLVIDKGGVTHYIKASFVELRWLNKDGDAANF